MVVFIRLAQTGSATKLSSVRALNQAKEKGQDLVTICSACHHVIKRVNDDMKNVEDIRGESRRLYASWSSLMKERQPFSIIWRFSGTESVLRNLKEKVVNPFTGKKIGAYYGCLLLRPGKIMAFDDPGNPRNHWRNLSVPLALSL